MLYDTTIILERQNIFFSVIRMATLKRKFCIIVNPNANNGHATYIMPRVIKTLERLNISFRCIISQDVAHAVNTAKEAIQLGECIVGVGGDGTLQALANVVIELNGTLAVIPAGRGNDFSKVINVPIDPILACEVLINGKEKKVDVGVANGKAYLTICTVGFDSVANAYANRAKWMHKSLVYLYGGLRALLTWKPAIFHLEIDDKIFTHIGYTVAVANGGIYGGGLKLAPDASLEDGLLDIVLIGEISKIRMLQNFPKAFKGKHIHEPGVTILRGKKIKINMEKTFDVYADGDVIAKLPVDIIVKPAALRIISG